MVNYWYIILNIVGPVYGTDSHVRLLQGCTSFRDRLSLVAAETGLFDTTSRLRIVAIELGTEFGRRTISKD